MRVLITGASGFVGKHLIPELHQHGHTPVAFDKERTDQLPDADQVHGDIADAQAVSNALRTLEPDACIHLAGVAFVPAGWSDPHLVMRINVDGTLNILEAFRAFNQQARILAVTSSEVYGREPRPEPVKESDTLTPSNLYGVSKMAADLSALLFQRQYDMGVMTARPQNHIGPHQSRLFVVSAFAEQLIALSRQGNPSGPLNTGNLESERDFTDVRDVVRAYRLLIEKGHAGEAYNIASDRMVPIRTLLEELCDHAGLSPAVKTDPDLYRPTDRPPKLCIQKIEAHTGWRPSIPLTETLKDIYDELATQV